MTCERNFAEGTWGPPYLAWSVAGVTQNHQILPYMPPRGHQPLCYTHEMGHHITKGYEAG